MPDGLPDSLPVLLGLGVAVRVVVGLCELVGVELRVPELVCEAEAGTDAVRLLVGLALRVGLLVAA